MNLRQLYRRVYKSWAVDVVLAVAVVLGFLALLFREEVITLLSTVIDHFLSAYKEFEKAGKGKKGVGDYLTPINIAIITGAVAFVVIVWRRVVYRLRNSRKFTSAVCPKCSHPLSRIRRSPFQKTLSYILPVRRYYCHNCHWKGVRVKSYASDDGIKDIRLKSGASNSMLSV